MLFALEGPCERYREDGRSRYGERQSRRRYCDRGDIRRRRDGGDGENGTGGINAVSVAGVDALALALMCTPSPTPLRSRRSGTVSAKRW
jgi:hypothetical protein